MMQLAEYVAAALLMIGGAFGLTGSFGLLKLRHTMQRLHAPTKATTVGLGGVLLASMVASFVSARVFSWHEALITLFLLLTAPITANLIAKAQMHRHIPEADIPSAGGGRRWATYDDDTPPEKSPDL